jgi:hypothetical protein
MRLNFNKIVKQTYKNIREKFGTNPFTATELRNLIPGPRFIKDGVIMKMKADSLIIDLGYHKAQEFPEIMKRNFKLKNGHYIHVYRVRYDD